MTPSSTTPVTNPTWYSDIRDLFNPTDIAHMRNQGLDLSLYEVVQANAMNIYSQVATGNMPPPPRGSTGPNPNAWPAAWVTTFLNWINAGCPKGTNAQPAASLLKAAALVATKASRIRKEITSLSATEMGNLKKAFSGILALPPTDPNSYFVQAGYHWLPGQLPGPQFFCQHHAPGYNPWHRAYLLSFENALRSIPGCETVTLPYWDITTPFPEVLKSAPFDSYTLPQDIGSGYGAGYVTQRFAYSDIATNLQQYDVTGDINRALTKTDWEDFHGMFAGASNDTIISAHDGGHVSIGTTMAAQAVAAFDPVFWFFHANWDRLFWKWQKAMQATTLNGLLSTINKTADPLSYMIFTTPAFEELKPFTANPPKLTTLSIIDSENSLGVDYQDPSAPVAMNFLAKTQRSAPIAKSFTVQPDRVNVRVQGVNRLKIPGSFKVHLTRDGQPIASKAFFQPNEAGACETCAKTPVVHFDFALPLATVTQGRLGVWIEPVDQSILGDRVPNKLMGSPTVEVHLPVQTE